jgi:hypothetical protein
VIDPRTIAMIAGLAFFLFLAWLVWLAICPPVRHVNHFAGYLLHLRKVKAYGRPSFWRRVRAFFRHEDWATLRRIRTAAADAVVERYLAPEPDRLPDAQPLLADRGPRPMLMGRVR